MEGVVNSLKSLDITEQEARTYIGLLELQETKTGPLCTHTGIASSNIYMTLESLIQKGLASYRIQNNVKIFMPAPPDALTELYKEKLHDLEQERERVLDIVKNLKGLKPETSPRSGYKYYEGIKGIKSMWHEINELLSEGELVRIHTAKAESYQRLIGFYDQHHALRKKLRVPERLLFPKSEAALAQKRADAVTEIRFCDLQNDAEWGVVQDSLFLQYITTKTPRAFLIHDAVFAETWKQAFDMLWETSTPL